MEFEPCVLHPLLGGYDSWSQSSLSCDDCDSWLSDHRDSGLRWSGDDVERGRLRLAAAHSLKTLSKQCRIWEEWRFWVWHATSYWMHLAKESSVLKSLILLCVCVYLRSCSFSICWVPASPLPLLTCPLEHMSSPVLTCSSLSLSHTFHRMLRHLNLTVLPWFYTSSCIGFCSLFGFYLDRKTDKLRCPTWSQNLSFTKLLLDLLKRVSFGAKQLDFSSGLQTTFRVQTRMRLDNWTISSHSRFACQAPENWRGALYEVNDAVCAEIDETKKWPICRIPRI